MNIWIREAIILGLHNTVLSSLVIFSNPNGNSPLPENTFTNLIIDLVSLVGVSVLVISPLLSLVSTTSFVLTPKSSALLSIDSDVSSLNLLRNPTYPLWLAPTTFLAIGISPAYELRNSSSEPRRDPGLAVNSPASLFNR